MKLVERVGVLGFYLAWPALYVYLKGSERTRVVVIWQGQVLAIKNWISDGRWSFPGGGLHAGEDPKEGARRELLEETGIQAASSDIEEVGSGRYRFHGLTYPFRSYVVRLTDEPVLHRQRIEVSRIAWLRLNELGPKQASPDVLMSLELLKTRHPDFLIQ